MNNPLETILQQIGLNNSYFAPTSRYYGLETKILESKDHKKHVFVKRRFIAQPEAYELLQEHQVTQGDRLDNISHQYLGDAELFWRICDPNAVMHPNKLTVAIGNIIKITMPEDMSGSR